MQTDKFIKRGSKYKRAESKELWAVRNGEKKKTKKEQLTVNLEPATSIFRLILLICKMRGLTRVSDEAETSYA